MCTHVCLIRNPDNELIFIINGTLEVEFEHPYIQRDGISPYINDYIDETSLLGTVVVLALLTLRSDMKNFSKHTEVEK
jgi:hypothetical protein